MESWHSYADRCFLDCHWRSLQPSETRYEERQTSIRSQLLPIQGLYLELWMLATGNYYLQTLSLLHGSHYE